ncbi:hypothetical protein [Streptomyces sp. SudanB91_2054]|uniref:hypothetical protein n=1 Tax=Streptomyces sp. SudanB91_2054 TaxID=3035278 RepID=UPI0036DA66D2
MSPSSPKAGQGHADAARVDHEATVGVADEPNTDPDHAVAEAGQQGENLSRLRARGDIAREHDVVGGADERVVTTFAPQVNWAYSTTTTRSPSVTRMPPPTWPASPPGLLGRCASRGVMISVSTVRITGAAARAAGRETCNEVTSLNTA